MEIKRGQSFALSSFSRSEEQTLQKHDVSQKKYSFKDFISDTLEEQSVIHQYMWRTDNKLVQRVFFFFKTDSTLRNVSFSGHFLIFLQ